MAKVLAAIETAFGTTDAAFEPVTPSIVRVTIKHATFELNWKTGAVKAIY